MPFIIIIITSSVPLSFLISGIGFVKAPSHYKRWLWLYILAFAVLAYCYTPTYTNDLMRYLNMIEQCKNLPFSYAFSWADDGLVVKNFWFWCLSKIDEPHLIQAISIGSLYGVTAYITCDSFRSNKRRLWIAMLLQILLLPLYLANSNIRNMVAFAFMFLAVYRDLVKGKRNILTGVLYVAPVFVHMAGLVVIIARLGVLVFRKHFKVGLVATFTMPSVILIAYPLLRNIAIPGNIGKIVQRAIWKSYTNVLSNSDYANSMRESGYVNACRIVMFVACVILIGLTLMYLYKKEEKTKGQYEFMIFDMIFCSITCIFILLGAVKFWVFGVASVIGSGTVLSCYFEGNRVGGIKQIMIYGLTLMALARAILEIYYISQRIVWGEYFSTLMTTNIWTIVFHIFKVFITGVK